jgi:hypothetical protein
VSCRPSLSVESSSVPLRSSACAFLCSWFCDRFRGIWRCSCMSTYLHRTWCRSLRLGLVLSLNFVQYFFHSLSGCHRLALGAGFNLQLPQPIQCREAPACTYGAVGLLQNRRALTGLKYAFLSAVDGQVCPSCGCWNYRTLYLLHANRFEIDPKSQTASQP